MRSFYPIFLFILLTFRLDNRPELLLWMGCIFGLSRSKSSDLLWPTCISSIIHSSKRNTNVYLFFRLLKLLSPIYFEFLITFILAVKYTKLRKKGLISNKQYCYENSGYKETIECQKKCVLEKLNVRFSFSYRHDH